jgi:predicted HicB family RNase H-like nuclease
LKLQKPISSETEARINDEARRQGVSVDAFLEQLIDERVAAAHIAGVGP